VKDTIFLANSRSIMIASIDEVNQVSEPVTVELDEGHKMRGFYTITN
jgi:hypothetical protein